MNKNVSDFLNSGVGLLVAGFIFTTLCGGLLNECNSQTTWKRDKKFELLKGTLEKHEKLLSELSKAVSERLHRLERVLWALEAPDSVPPDKMWQLDDAARKRIDDRWNEYYSTVNLWNLNYRDYTTRLRLLAGPEVAERFFAADPVVASRSKPDTVFGDFERCHDLIKQLRDTALNSPGVDRAERIAAAQNAVNGLYKRADGFIAEIYQALDERAKVDDPLASSHARR